MMTIKEKFLIFSKNISDHLFSLIVIPIAIFFLAFLPRIVDLGTGYTTDEGLWIVRAPTFIDAVFRADFIHTYITGTPGVTTMWFSGVFLKLFSNHGMDFPQFLSIGRFPVALITALGILLMYLLLKDSLNEKIAILASVLIALDPFYLAHSRLIHLDALLTTFMVLSILSFHLYIHKPEKNVLLIMSGAFLGLALLTKLPALSLIPYFILVLILWQLMDSYHNFHNLKKSVFTCISATTFTVIFKAFFIIIFISGLVFVILWPAMWVAPLVALNNLSGNLEIVVEHPNGLYFLGQVMTTDNYKYLYYIFTFLTMTTPIVLFFSTICIILLFVSFRNMRLTKINFSILYFLLYILLFFALMTIGEKKGGRYLLPVFPVINILAAIGIYYCYKCISNLLTKTLKNRFNIIRNYSNLSFGIIVALVIVLQSVLIIPLAPYYLSYSNPFVLGGSQNIKEYTLVGWGEGQDLAAAYLNNKPESSNLTVGVQYAGFKEYFIGKTVSMGDPNSTPPDYLVFYSCAVQRNFNGNLLEKYRNETPEKVIIINNIEYCWIYPTHKDQVS